MLALRLRLVMSMMLVRRYMTRWGYELSCWFFYGAKEARVKVCIVTRVKMCVVSHEGGKSHNIILEYECNACLPLCRLFVRWCFLCPPYSPLYPQTAAWTLSVVDIATTQRQTHCQQRQHCHQDGTVIWIMHRHCGRRSYHPARLFHQEALVLHHKKRNEAEHWCGDLGVQCRKRWVCQQDNQRMGDLPIQWQQRSWLTHSLNKSNGNKCHDSLTHSIRWQQRSWRTCHRLVCVQNQWGRHCWRYVWCTLGYFVMHIHSLTRILHPHYHHLHKYVWWTHSDSSSSSSSIFTSSTRTKHYNVEPYCVVVMSYSAKTVCMCVCVCQCKYVRALVRFASSWMALTEVWLTTTSRWARHCTLQSACMKKTRRQCIMYATEILRCILMMKITPIGSRLTCYYCC